jgi:hypothetical protein
MQENELIYIQWHDSEIERISVLLEGNLEISFKALIAYFKNESGRFEMWNYKATVVMTGVTGFTVDNIIADEFIDGNLLDADGNIVELMPIGTKKQVDCFKIYAAGAGGGQEVGANIEIKAKTANITNFEPLSFLREVLETDF